MVSSSLNSAQEGSAVIRNLLRRILREFMDIVILAEMQKRELSGYDVILFFHGKFQMLISSGSIYSLLYHLEREGLIEGISDNRKRKYRLTDKGMKMIDAIITQNSDLNLMAILRIGAKNTGA